MDNLLNAFCEFVETLPEAGKAIVCGDNENIRYVMSRVKRTFITYGLEDNNDYVAKIFIMWTLPWYMMYIIKALI